MTSFGSCVEFPIGDPRLLSPEAIADGPSFSSQRSSSSKTDTWSVGVIIYQLVTGKWPWGDNEQEDAFPHLLNVLNFSGHEIHIAVEEQKRKDLEASDVELLRHKENGGWLPQWKCMYKEKERQEKHEILSKNRREKCEMIFGDAWERAKVSEDLKDIVKICLVLDPLERVSAKELLRHPYFGDLEKDGREVWVTKPIIKSHLFEKGVKVGEKKKASGSFSVRELFHFWQVAGGDLEVELSDELKIDPAIRRLPTIVRARGGNVNPNDSRLYDEMITPISLESLRERLNNTYNKRLPLDNLYLFSHLV